VTTIKCKVYGSKLYCYDKENNAVYVYPRQRHELTECPECVISAFINDNYDAEIIMDEKPETGRENGI